MGLTFNVNKSECMIINPVDKKKDCVHLIPAVYDRCGQCMQFISEFRYLGLGL